jgi:predicted nuclease of predicted toxin-antitoxin system
MIKFLADENFNGKILKALLKQFPNLDIVRVQDTELYQQDDPTVLEWSAQHQRILLTHDVKTMVGFANERIINNLPTAVIIVPESLSLAIAIADLNLIISASNPQEWQNLVTFLPL